MEEIVDLSPIFKKLFLPFCMRWQQCQNSILIQMNQNPILNSTCTYIGSGRCHCVKVAFAVTQGAGQMEEWSDCCTPQASPSCQWHACSSMSFTGTQYKGTQVQVNKTE